MKLNIAIYVLVTIPFLIIGYISSNIILDQDKDKSENLFIGNSKILYNTYYDAYEVEELIFYVRQAVNTNEEYYNPEFHKVKITHNTQELLEDEFNTLKNKLLKLNEELVSIELKKFNYISSLLKTYNNDLAYLKDLIEKTNSSLKENADIYLSLLGKIYDLEREEYNMKIHILDDNQVTVKKDLSFVKLGEITYSTQPLNFQNNSRVVVILTFFVIGLFVSWSTIEIKNYFIRRNKVS